MRLLPILLLALLQARCAHVARPEPEASSELPPDTSFRVHPHVGTAEAQLAVILSPPGELPVWSCEGAATNGGFSCPVATDWFRGPGDYEVLAELKTGAEVLRASRTVAITGEGPTDVSLWFVESPKAHLELAGGAGKSLPSAGSNGTLTREQIRSEIEKGKPAIRGCYAGALQDSPGLEARLETWFLIEPDGTVNAASARGAPNNPELVYCVLAKVKAFQFPKPRGGALAVTYPFVFSPE